MSLKDFKITNPLGGHTLYLIGENHVPYHIIIIKSLHIRIFIHNSK